MAPLLLIILLFSPTAKASTFKNSIEKMNDFLNKKTEPVFRHLSCYTHCNQVFGKRFGKELSSCGHGGGCLKDDVAEDILNAPVARIEKNAESSTPLAKGYACLRNCLVKCCSLRFLCQVLGNTTHDPAIKGIGISLKRLRQSCFHSIALTQNGAATSNKENLLSDFLLNSQFHEKCLKLFRHHPKQLKNYTRNRQILTDVLSK